MGEKIFLCWECVRHNMHAGHPQDNPDINFAEIQVFGKPLCGDCAEDLLDQILGDAEAEARAT